MRTCCNPYGIGHTKIQNRSTTPIVNLERCEAVLPNFPWTEGLYLCLGCRLRMLKDHKQRGVQKAGVLHAKMAAAKRKSNVPTDAASDVESREQLTGDDNTKTNESGVKESTAQSIIPTTTSTQGLYPELPAGPCSSQQAIEQDPASYLGVLPSAPAEETEVGPNPEPESSSADLGIQLPYNPMVTPTGSSGSSSSGSPESSALKRSMDLNKTLQEEVISPVLPSDIRRPGKLRKKFKAWKTRANKAFKRATGTEASPQTRKSKACAYCNRLFAELCDKFKVQDTREDKEKLLTCVPHRFSITEVAEQSGCTLYLARKASALKNKDGAYSSSPPRVGKPMDPAHEEIVRKFYKKPENSRASPNETILIKTGGDPPTRPIAKMRILHSLNDLYQEFKREHPEIKCSISKFCKLRPKNCVWPGLRGHHVTCVCETHQNFDFLLEAIDSKIRTREFVKNAVCHAEEGELRPDCHLGICSDCPKPEYLNGLFETVLLDEAISYSQWLRTDATEIKHVTLSVEDFQNMFYEYVPKIIEHDYITQKQNSYIKHLRDVRVKDCSAITVQVDFAQNYNFVVQNSVQGFHWTNKQATIHPFVVHYYDSEEDKVKYKTYCVISDEMVHDADTFHVFRSRVMTQIKEDLKHIPIQKVYYVSDGCAGQYKGIKNFANLFSHKEDYGFDAEWHFCATSHGKSTCDAMSACVKCSAKRESLVRGQIIIEAQVLFNYCESQLTTSKLCFFYVTKEEVAAQRPILAERYKPFKPIKGTRKHHVFIPQPDGVMLMGRTSDSDLFTPVDFKAGEVCEFNSSNVKLGYFYAFLDGGKYHAGLLVEQDSEEGDVKFQLLKLNRNTRVASWPEPPVFTDIAYRDILKELKEPETRDGINFLINKDDMGNIRTRFNAKKLQLAARL